MGKAGTTGALGPTVSITEMPGQMLVVSAPGSKLRTVQALLSKLVTPGYRVMFGTLEPMQLTMGVAQQPDATPLGPGIRDENPEDIDASLEGFIRDATGFQYRMADLMENVLPQRIPSVDADGRRNPEYTAFLARCKRIERHIAAENPGMSFEAIKGAPKGTRGLVPKKN